MLPLAVDLAYSILSPEEAPRVDVGRWTSQARSFFDCDLAFVQTLAAVLPTTAAFEIDVIAKSTTRVSLRTFPCADGADVMAAADRAVVAIGGAGMDALVARAKRIWQVALACEGDPRAPLALAGILASTLLGPIVPPDAATIFGTRGARTRLAAEGWP